MEMTIRSKALHCKAAPHQCVDVCVRCECMRRGKAENGGSSAKKVETCRTSLRAQHIILFSRAGQQAQLNADAVQLTELIWLSLPVQQ